MTNWTKKSYLTGSFGKRKKAIVGISRLLFLQLTAAHQHVLAFFVFPFRNVDICTDLSFNLLNTYILFAFRKGHFKGHFDHYRLGRFGQDDCTMYTALLTLHGVDCAY